VDKRKPLYELISLKGKSSLITGAASGIVRAVALGFGEAGSNLILVGINPERGLRGVAEKIKERYGVNIDT